MSTYVVFLLLIVQVIGWSLLSSCLRPCDSIVGYSHFFGLNCGKELSCEMFSSCECGRNAAFDMISSSLKVVQVRDVSIDTTSGAFAEDECHDLIVDTSVGKQKRHALTSTTSTTSLCDQRNIRILKIISATNRE